MREDLSQREAEDYVWYQLSSLPVTAAWLLPIAERVAPELARECFWRALAMRSPRPIRDDLDDKLQIGEFDLIKKLARYDCGVAQFLLQPSLARLPEWSRAAVSDNNSPAGLAVGRDARWMIRYVMYTAAHVSPAWSADLMASLRNESATSRSPRNEAMLSIVQTLSLAGDDRWTRDDGRSAGFWSPPHAPVEVIDLFR